MDTMAHLKPLLSMGICARAVSTHIKVLMDGVAGVLCSTVLNSEGVLLLDSAGNSLASVWSESVHTSYHPCGRLCLAVMVQSLQECAAQLLHDSLPC